jgi:hypothetical protein
MDGPSWSPSYKPEEPERVVTEINLSKMVDGRLTTTTHHLRDDPGVIRRVEPYPTLRDHFAMAALTGLLGSHDYMRIPESQLNRERVCENVYEWADHMLRARVRPCGWRA